MLDFIINPIAGGQHGKKCHRVVDALKTTLEARGIDHRFHFSAEKGDAQRLTASAIENGATDIIVVGGDGTLHEVLNGFSNFENVNMGLIPCGTGNDFAENLRISHDPVEALDLILNGTPKFTDYMQMPTVRGINVIGMGIDVAVLKRYSMLKKKTKFGYTRSLISTLFKFKPMNFTATINGENREYNSFIMAVANGHCFGGGIPVCPDAKSDDNVLELITVKGMSKLKLIFAFIKLKGGKILQVKQASREKITHIEAETPKPYVVNVDGELYDDIPFVIDIVPNTLKFYRP